MENVTKKSNTLLESMNDSCEAFVERRFKNNLARHLSNKIKKSKMQRVEFSMGVYFAVIDGNLHGDGGFDWPNGCKREFKLLHEIAEICEDRRFCRNIDCLSIINSFLT